MKRQLQSIKAVYFGLVLGASGAAQADTNGMAYVPAGSYTRGDENDGNAYKDEYPGMVYINAFSIDTNLVTGALWLQVYTTAKGMGYVFDNAGTGAGNIPVGSVSWYDAVKWCNARSVIAGYTPCYYTDTNQTTVYTQGDVSLTAANVKWSANGFRLPTEAEWEKAARGGVAGQRFPSSNIISHAYATYQTPGSPVSYDAGPLNVFPTVPSAVALYPTNGFGLHDMAGNLREMCWDWYAFGYYTNSFNTTDPRGPATGSARVNRGGGWFDTANVLRCAARDDVTPVTASTLTGFRTVRVDNKQTPGLEGQVSPNASITYGQSLSSASPLSGVFTNLSGTTVAGSIVFAQPSIAPFAGTTNVQVIFEPTDTNDYLQTTAMVAITVNPAALDIYADSDTKVYGQTKSYGAASTAFTTGAGELVTAKGDTVTSVTLSCSGAAASATYTSPGPSYDIVASAAAGSGLANYSITYHAGKLTVSQAALDLYATSDSKVYGQSKSYGAGSIAFTAGAGELVAANGDGITSVTLSSSGAAASASYTSPGPTYAIIPASATGSGMGNYSIVYHPGTLTVSPAALDIFANSSTKTYGQSVNLGAGSTAFTTGSGQLATVNGDAVTSVTLSSSGAAASATYTTPGPAYAIGVSGAAGIGLANYSITYHTGVLTLVPAPLYISATNTTKVYAQTLPLNGLAFSTGAGQLVTANGDSVTGVTLSSAGATNTAAVDGSPYSITVSNATGAGLGNYTISYVPGELTVEPIPLTITANNAMRLYGTPNPAFSVNYSAFANGENASVLGGALSVWSPATPAFLPGVYSNTIIPYLTGPTNNNYNIGYAYGTLTITNLNGGLGVTNSDGSVNVAVLASLIQSVKVSSADMNVVLANYWTNSPPVFSAFTAGKTNFTFSIADFTFEVQMSHDMAHWTNLGVSEFEFADTNSYPTPTNAFYRVITLPLVP